MFDPPHHVGAPSEHGAEHVVREALLGRLEVLVLEQLARVRLELVDELVELELELGHALSPSR